MWSYRLFNYIGMSIQVCLYLNGRYTYIRAVVGNEVDGHRLGLEGVELGVAGTWPIV